MIEERDSEYFSSVMTMRPERSERELKINYSETLDGDYPE